MVVLISIVFPVGWHILVKQGVWLLQQVEL